MRRASRLLAVHVVAWAWLSGAVPAVSADGYTICGRPYDPSNQFSWEQVQARYAAAIGAKAYKSVVASLRGELLAMTGQADPDLTARFDAAAGRLELVFPAQCSDFSVFKEDGGRELAPTKYWIFRSHPQEALLLNDDCDNEPRQKEMQDLRHLTGSITQLCALALNDPMRATAEQIDAIEARFDRYLFEGFPMFPWEALANSWLLRREHLAGGPPIDQIVLFHPTAGIVVKTTTFSEAEPDLSLGVDLLGWVHYPKAADYRSWWGISAMGSIAKDRGAGLGLALHWDNFRLAAVFHDDDRDGHLFDGNPSVFLGVDLYHFVKEKYRSYESYKAKLRQLQKPTE